MATLKFRPNELAIHGGGPPAFASKLPVFSPNVGSGQRFAALAEQMFLASECPGRLAEQFEEAFGTWVGARNAIAFSSLRTATLCLNRCQPSRQPALVSALGYEAFEFQESFEVVECEGTSFGMSPAALAEVLRPETPAVLAVHPLGRSCAISALEEICDDHDVPLYFYAHQGLGSCHEGERLGSFGRAEVFELGRDQLVHAMDTAVITTDDDLLAHRLRSFRSSKNDGADQGMTDAAAAMAIANLESAVSFIEANRIRYEFYRKYLQSIEGISLVQHSRESNFQTIALDVDPGKSGLTSFSLHDVLSAENVGTSKPFYAAGTPNAGRIAANLIQLPNGPTVDEESIAAVCRLVELAIVRSIESPDPVRLAA